jgi:hypothetical protein
MTDNETPPSSFPSYQPPAARAQEGPHFADAKQAKPLLKILNRLVRPRTKSGVARVKKGLARKKHSEYGWVE